MAQARKKPVRKQLDHDKITLYSIGVILLCVVAMVAFTAGYNMHKVSPLSQQVVLKSKYANAEVIKLARGGVEDAFFRQSTTCSDDDNKSYNDRVKTFYQYLAVNRLANRAVIRGCNDMDTLLYRAKDGSWQASTVNISLDLRANPSWSKACQVEDLLVGDTEVRPENASIDQMNLEQCQKIATL